MITRTCCHVRHLKPSFNSVEKRFKSLYSSVCVIPCPVRHLGFNALKTR